MRRSICLVAAFFAVAGPAFAETCPPPQVDATERDALMEALAAAESPAAAQGINARLWQIWTTAPDAAAQDLLDSGVARLRVSDFAAAEAAFDALVAYCPDYAEGYNQRAFSFYLREAYEPALTDLERALERRPDHVGALSGKALTLMGLGRDAEALEALEVALERHPWLNERALVPVLRERLGIEDL